MDDAAAGRHPVHFARQNRLGVARAVTVHHRPFIQVGDGGPADVRVRAHVDARAGIEFHRTHVVKEHARPDGSALRRRDRTADGKAAQVAGARHHDGFNLVFACIGQRPTARSKTRPGGNPSARPRALRQVKHQHFGVLAGRQLDSGVVSNSDRVTGRELGAVDRDAAPRHMHPGAAASGQGQSGGLGPVEQASIQARVLMDLHRAVFTIRRHQGLQPATLLRVAESALFVLRGNAGHVGLDPDLQHVRFGVRQRVELGVHHTAASAHPLHVAGLDGRTAAHAVLVRNGAVQHIGDDLHVPMAVRAEAAAGSNAVVIDHAQCAEAHVSRGVVVGEGKGVKRIEPPMVGVTPFGSAANRKHCGLLFQ
ncbi:hypothetical protein G6F65_016343 [Rhizopus arrhizus]|nr:hypothetical protein G6F65_016343 [Rhizopus arrhizus]